MMGTFFVFIGLLGLIACVIILIIFRRKKKPLKIPAILLAVFFVCLFLGIFLYATGTLSTSAVSETEKADQAATDIETAIGNPGTATSIIELGGSGNGVFDNTAVIQNAENKGIDLYFPDGVYRINGYILKKNSSWYGQSKLGTILLYDNDFNYKVPSSLENSSDSDNSGSPFLRTEFSTAQNIKTDDYNSFTMQDFTLKWRVTKDWLAPDGNPDLWYVGNCKNLVLRNLFFDSDDPDVVGTAFFTTIGSVDGLLIENCTFTQDSNPLLGNSLGYGGPLCLQNFTRTRGSYNFVIRNNEFIKKHGADECLWVSSGSNCIDGIYILNNHFDVTSNDPDLGFQSTAIRISSNATTDYSTPGKSYVDNIYIIGNTITGGSFAYSVIAVNESADHSMPPINYVNVSDNVINATTNFNVDDYDCWACAMSLNGEDTVYSIAENNTIAGNFEAGISGFQIVKNNTLNLTDCNLGIQDAKTAEGNEVNISGIGTTGIE